MKNKFFGTVTSIVLMVVLSGLSAPLALERAAPRDYLTPKEEERVKEAQVLDKRIEVFIKAAERRLLVLTDPAAASSKQVQKDAEKWGELPQGTRVELIMDVANILDAAITNIDDVALRDEKNRLIPKAMQKLADAATRFQAQLTAIRGQAFEGQERRALEQVMSNVQEILEAAGKLPPETKEKSKS